ncbi:site-specific integrase [Microbacterium xylanilyticum]
MVGARGKITDALGRERKATRASFGKVRKLPSGRYQASYVGPDGGRHTAPQTYVAKIDAESWLAVQRAQIVQGEWAPAIVKAKDVLQRERAQTLGTYAADWIKTRTGRNGEPLRHTTRAEYERMLRLPDSAKDTKNGKDRGGPLAPLVTMPLAAITPESVRSWYSKLVKAGQKTTAARAYGLLRSVLQTAVQDGLIPVNPCQIRGAQNASTGKKTLPPTSAELLIIQQSMPEHLRAAVSVAAWGALRYGELTELRRKDVTFDGDVAMVNVTRAVTRVKGGGFHVGPPKSEAGVRTVALPPAVSRELKQHIEQHAQPGPDGLLFPSVSGGHLGESTFVRAWYPARAAAGRDDLPWHGLRHFGLSRYALTGATLREIQERAGHSTIAAAMRYQHGGNRDAELAARMAELS